MPSKLAVRAARWCWLAVLMASPGLPAVETAPAAQAPLVTEDPLERRVLDIAKDLRCAVCQNQPISESNADLARDMRNIIREKLQAGESRDQIIDYFVQRYGDYVLLKPPLDSAGTVVWLIPPLVFIMLAGAAVFFIRQRSHRAVPPAPMLSDEDRERVRAARQQDPDAAGPQDPDRRRDSLPSEAEDRTTTTVSAKGKKKSKKKSKKTSSNKGTNGKR